MYKLQIHKDAEKALKKAQTRIRETSDGLSCVNRIEFPLF